MTAFWSNGRERRHGGAIFCEFLKKRVMAAQKESLRKLPLNHLSTTSEEHQQFKKTEQRHGKMANCHHVNDGILQQGSKKPSSRPS